MTRRILPAALAVLALASCSDPVTEGPRFRPLTAAATGVDFRNDIPENDSINIIEFEYMYNGGGVGVGDFDGDGRADLFFTGNFVSSRLYLQREDWEFTDVTAAAGLTTDYWCAGVNVADVDGNGYEDLYLATLNPAGDNDVPNRLFLNQGPGADGVPTFVESAAALGLADSAYATQSSWVDFDGDGDLDLYLLNNAIETFSRNAVKGTDTLGRGRSTDALYRNLLAETGRLRFERLHDWRTEGWGLGLVVQDFDRDGRPNLYVANDFIANDFYFDFDSTGRPRESVRDHFAHTSLNSMGVDAGDLNNDGYPDLMVVDMLPDDNLRRKTMFPDIPYQRRLTSRQRGYVEQNIRNTLQINNGDGTFSDLAYQTGTAATDWSWTPLLADFDNDGRRDIFVSNGYPKDITNMDFIDFSESTSAFGTEESRRATVFAGLQEVAGVHQPNYFFRNEGGLRFSRPDWLSAQPTYANGAAYADLDRDGDLDLITNNINEPAGLYRNLSRERDSSATHFLRLELRGPATNPHALGARIYLRADSLRLYHEHQRVRGYLSTLEQAITLGTGRHRRIDSLVVVWPDGRATLRTDLAADQTLTLSTDEATVADGHRLIRPAPRPAVLRPVPLDAAPAAPPSLYSDFNNYALALRDLSREDPALATLDLDGDGRDELVFGGNAGQPVQIFADDGAALRLLQELPATREAETTSLAVLDYDGDGHPDLYVGNGSSEFPQSATQLADQLYRNAGGRLVPAPAGALAADLPSVATAVVRTADLEGDGDPDLFVGARLAPGQYPRAAPSLLLRNEGGRFVLAGTLSAGMVTDAAWTDLTGDGLPDLMTVGEFTPPTLFRNTAGTLGASDTPDENLSGWWYSLTPWDADGDGDTDLLAGNVGRNAPYTAAPDHPLTVHAADFDNNGALDPIVTAHNGETAYPVHPRNTLARQMPTVKNQLTSYRKYGTWTEANIPPVPEGGVLRSAREFRSAYLENDGSGHFTPHFLPDAGQTAPLRAALPLRLADGRPGLLAVQNDYHYEVLGGRLDAGTGFALALDAAGRPAVLPDYWSVRADARSLVALNGRYVVGVNGGPLRMYE